MALKWHGLAARATSGRVAVHFDRRERDVVQDVGVREEVEMLEHHAGLAAGWFRAQPEAMSPAGQPPRVV